MFLNVVDVHSKWPEVILMKSAALAKNISKLREVFAQHGIPEIIGGDNGPQFASDEFVEFAKANCTCHI